MTELTKPVIRKFFVAYSWQLHAGFGPGHTFATLTGADGEPSKVTQEVIEGWSRDISRTCGYSSTVITFYRELEG